jgi:putative phosphoesterase
MKIAVISDTHGCVHTWRHVYQRFFADADAIIHAGDILYHGPRNTIPAEYNPQELIGELNACPIPLFFAQGNCDAEVDGMVLNDPIVKSCFLVMDGVRILVRHGHDLSKEEITHINKRYHLDILITGHTHIAEVVRDGQTICLNPGSPAMSKRADGQGTFAMITKESVGLYEVENGSLLCEVPLFCKLP